MNSPNRAACLSSAAALLADTTHGTIGGSAARSATSTVGGASMITCALVPLMPNDDTPARRTRPFDRPWPSLGQQRYGARRPIHMRAGLIDVQGRRQYLVAHRQDHFHHAGHAGCGLGVTHVRLDRPQPQGLGPVLSVGWPAAPAPRSDRPASCPCRDLPPRRRRRSSARR